MSKTSANHLTLNSLTKFLRSLPPEQKAKLVELVNSSRKLWTPLPGPQTQALSTDADVLYYGGAAGGGKTDLLIGLALTEHERSIVYRREGTQLQAIYDRMAEILGTRDGFNSQARIWRTEEKQIEFGSCPHLGDEQAYQGRPHDLICFDEITHFLEYQFRFLSGWLRTTTPDQRKRIICAGNPPTDAEGEWIIRYFAPWLDDQHPNPAKPGELRYYAMIDGVETEVASGEMFEHGGEEIEPQSRTFIPSQVDDNPYLTHTGYKAQLQALPEPLRSQMLHGDFTAGKDDDAFQVIPTQWVKEAQERWKPDGNQGKPMTALGVDVARGGKDETVLQARHENWFAEPFALPGKATPDGPAVAGLCVQHRKSEAVVQIDVIGVGSSPYDHLKDAGVPVVAMHSAEKTEETDKAGQMRFFNKRALWWWRMREALDPNNEENICLPPTKRVLSDLTAPRWRLQGGKIKVEEKEEIIKRLGRSPDYGDALVLALPTNLLPRDDLMDFGTAGIASWQSA